MTSTARSQRSVTIVALDPPFVTGDGVLVGADSDVDFAGPHVHGRRGDRFVYSWGVSNATEPFAMFARAKIKLNSIPGHLIADHPKRDDPTDLSAEGDRDLIARLNATDPRGQHASGTIEPPAIEWHTT